MQNLTNHLNDISKYEKTLYWKAKTLFWKTKKYIFKTSIKHYFKKISWTLFIKLSQKLTQKNWVNCWTAINNKDNLEKLKTNLKSWKKISRKTKTLHRKSLSRKTEWVPQK